MPQLCPSGLLLPGRWQVAAGTTLGVRLELHGSVIPSSTDAGCWPLPEHSDLDRQPLEECHEMCSGGQGVGIGLGWEGQEPQKKLTSGTHCDHLR